mmetsp:Transcript_13899/g.33562  ORF Transcript_13899/g.33562 Transcript_13899/m.33562 type:complete len:236 (-) Transcript_13899:3855-4562(-)
MVTAASSSPPPGGTDMNASPPPSSPSLLRAVAVPAGPDRSVSESTWMHTSVARTHAASSRKPMGLPKTEASIWEALELPPAPPPPSPSFASLPTAPLAPPTGAPLLSVSSPPPPPPASLPAVPGSAEEGALTPRHCASACTASSSPVVQPGSTAFPPPALCWGRNVSRCPSARSTSPSAAATSRASTSVTSTSVSRCTAVRRRLECVSLSSPCVSCASWPATAATRADMAPVRAS